MITITLNNFLFIKREVIYFADRPVFLFKFLTTYVQSNSLKKHFGYKRIPKYTKIINLNLSNDEILNGFNNNTKRGVNWCFKENIKFDFDLPYKEFNKLYNEFAKAKKFPLLKDNTYFKNNLFISTAYFEDNPIVCHTYLLDKESRIVRLMHTISLISIINDKSLIDVIGKSNRYLHYNDMLYFKGKGFEIYDFGGYAYGTVNESLQGINRFKDGFGGSLIEQSNYSPFLLNLLLRNG